MARSDFPTCLSSALLVARRKDGGEKGVPEAKGGAGMERVPEAGDGAGYESGGRGGEAMPGLHLGKLASQCIVLLQEVGGLHCLYMSFPEISAISVYIVLFQRL